MMKSLEKTRVRRYWPGKALEWVEEGDKDEDVRMQKVSVLDIAFPEQDDFGVSPKDDPRLLRLLTQTRIENRDEIRADYRLIRQAEILFTEEEELRNQETRDEEEDEEALEERRSRIREQNLKRVQEEYALLPVEEDDEGESEYETDSEDDMPGIIRIKPDFLPKAKRYKTAECEPFEAEEQALKELVKRKLEIRKVETEKK